MKRSVQQGTYGAARPDVEAAFGERDGARSGFEISVTLTPKHCDCRLEAQLEDGSWHLFRLLSLKAPARSLLQDGRRWARSLGPVSWQVPEGLRSVAVPTEDTPFRCFIEHPPTSRLAEHRVAIRGWCYHRTGVRILAVRARVRRVVQHGTYGMARPDVAAAFGESSADQSGFEIRVTVTPKRCNCRLEAQLEDGTWRVFRVLNLETPPRSLLHEVRWWTRARLQAPEAAPDAAELDADSADFRFRSFVEAPATLRVTGHRTAIRGWCYHRAGAKILAVRARVGRSHYLGRNGAARPDVEAAFGEPGAARSGFEIPASRRGCGLRASRAD